MELDAYHIRDGVVIGFDAQEQTEHSYRRGGKANSYTVMRATPIIKYYSQNDTVIYDEGKRTLLSYITLNDSAFYTTGEKLKILELKTNPDKVRPFTLFHYWIYTYELIFICLVAFIIFGALKVFGIKKSRA